MASVGILFSISKMIFGSAEKRMQVRLEDELSRYREERFEYNEAERRVIPMIEKLAQAKLNAWSDYARFFRIYRQIDNKPRRITYGGHSDIYMGAGDVERLEEVSQLVRELKQHKLNKIGTGILTQVALCGGAVNVQKEDESYKDKGSKRSLLDDLVENHVSSELLGDMDERSELKKVLHLPRVMKDQDMMSEDKFNQLEETEARRRLSILSARSAELAEFRQKLDSLYGLMLIVYDRFSLLIKLSTDAMEKLDKLSSVKRDYRDFTAEERNNFSYVLVLGVYVRMIAKEDLVLITAGSTMLNMTGVHRLFREVQDLVPIEDQYTFPGDTQAQSVKSAEQIQKELKKLRQEIEERNAANAAQKPKTEFKLKSIE